jgi:hypothetical protein
MTGGGGSTVVPTDLLPHEQERLKRHANLVQNLTDRRAVRVKAALGPQTPLTDDVLRKISRTLIRYDYEDMLEQQKLIKTHEEKIKSLEQSLLYTKHIIETYFQSQKGVYRGYDPTPTLNWGSLRKQDSRERALRVAAVTNGDLSDVERIIYSISSSRSEIEKAQKRLQESKNVTPIREEDYFMKS